MKIYKGVSDIYVLVEYWCIDFYMQRSVVNTFYGNEDAIVTAVVETLLKHSTYQHSFKLDHIISFRSCGDDVDAFITFKAVLRIPLDVLALNRGFDFHPSLHFSGVDGVAVDA